MLTDEFFDSGLDAVIVNGPFFTFEERDAFLRPLRARVSPRFITLRVSFEEAVRRAQGDPLRTVSRDRAWLAERHAPSEALLPLVATTDLLIDTDGKAPREIAYEISATLPLLG